MYFRGQVNKFTFSEELLISLIKSVRKDILIRSSIKSILDTTVKWQKNTKLSEA